MPPLAALAALVAFGAARVAMRSEMASALDVTVTVG